MKMNKKIILIILGIVLVTIAVVISIIFMNNREVQQDEKQNINIEQDNNEDKEETDEKKEEDSELEFWLNSKKWSNKKVENIEIFNDKISTPINLEQLDICSAPYSIWPNGVDQTNINQIKEILESDILMYAGRESKISTQEKYENGWKYYDDEPDNIDNIYIKNYSETNISIAECYNKGWWYIRTKINVDGALGFDVKKNPEYKGGWNEMPLLDGMIEKIGDPTMVWLYYGELEENNGNIMYDLVYERNDYVVAITASEMILKEYDSYIGTCDQGLRYYTKAAWDMERKDYIIERETIKNGMKIQIGYKK